MLQVFVVQRLLLQICSILFNEALRLNGRFAGEPVLATYPLFSFSTSSGREHLGVSWTGCNVPV